MVPDMVQDDLGKLFLKSCDHSESKTSGFYLGEMVIGFTASVMPRSRILRLGMVTEQPARGQSNLGFEMSRTHESKKKFKTWHVRTIYVYFF
jgi:hypothetical protein